MGAASLPGIGEPLAVAALGPAAADADHVEAVRAGLERADDRRRDAQDVPRGDLDDLAVEAGTARAGDDHVDLLLLAMPVAPRHAGSRLVREPADAQLA